MGLAAGAYFWQLRQTKINSERGMGMRILRYTVENFKKLRFIDVEPGAIWTIFSGRNGQGKTSALAGLDALKHGKIALPAHPVRRGAKNAKLSMLLSDEEGKPYLIVEGVATQERGWSLQIVPAPGRERPAGTPQEVMNEFVGMMAMDPLEFIAMKPKEQLEFLRLRLKVDVDLDDLANATRLDYAERTQVNNKAKELRAQAGAMVVSPGLPKEKVDEEAIQARLREAGNANKKIMEQLTEKTRLAQALNEAEMHETRHMQLIAETTAKVKEEEDRHPRSMEQIEKAKKIGAALQTLIVKVRELTAPALEHTLLHAEQQTEDYIVAANAEGAELVDAIVAKRKILEAAKNTEQLVHNSVAQARIELEQASSGEMIDTNELMSELQQAQLTNREIDKRARREDLEAQIMAQERKSADLTRAMEGREEKKRDALANANIPVKGLMLSESGVLCDGLLLSELGDAEQLRIVCALAMSTNPTLRCMPIARGEALDEDNLKMLEKMAEEHNFQIFMARVDTSGKVGIVLEDGAVAAVNQ
jgi:hypothetical protein